MPKIKLWDVIIFIITTFVWSVDTWTGWNYDVGSFLFGSIFTVYVLYRKASGKEQKSNAKASSQA